MHSSHDIILQAGIVYTSFKTTVGDIEWSNSRRVDCVLYTFTTRYHIAGWLCYQKTLVDDTDWSDNGRFNVGLL